MKFRILPIATLFIALMGTATLQAQRTKADINHVDGYGTMTYRNIYVAGGNGAAVALEAVGNSKLRLSVYDYNDNLIVHTTCHGNTCVASWVALWDASFYVVVENLGSRGTDYAIALGGE